MQEIYLSALLGGLLIGISASLLLLLNGRIAGISGIFNGIFTRQSGDRNWRLYFIVALPIGAWIPYHTTDSNYFQLDQFSPWTMLAAGLLVGMGTRIGSGCTSGHGVCGLGNLSWRSLAATLTFMCTAMLSLYVFRHVLGVN